ncbi:Hypothetical predicted protein, partial [Pelobates cultripes]
ATLKVWCLVRRTLQLSTTPSLLTQITHNTEVARGLSPSDMKGFRDLDWIYFHQWNDGPNLKTITTLLGEGAPTGLQKYRYNQIAHHFSSLPGSSESSHHIQEFLHH